MLSFKTEDFERMKEIERALVQTLLPYRNDGRTEAMLVVFALIRSARVLLRLYPAKTQKQLRPVITAFLEGKTSAPAADAMSGFLIQQ